MSVELLNVKNHQLKQETLSYFRKIQNHFDQKLDKYFSYSDPDFEILLRSVFDEIEGNEESLLLNRHTSRTLEILFKTTKDLKKLLKFFLVVSNRFLDLSRGRCSSHPLQAILGRFGELKLEKNEMATFYDEIKKILNKFVKNFFVLSECQFATFVVRDIIKIFPDLFDDFDLKKLKIRENKRIEKRFCVKLTRKIIKLKSVFDKCRNKHFSPVLSTLISKMSDGTKRDRKYVRKLCEKIIFNNDFILLCCNPISSFLAQTILTKSTEETMNEITKIILPKIKFLSLHKNGNFVVQSIFQNKNLSQKTFLAIFNELKPHFKNLLDENKTLIIAKMSEFCTKNEETQKIYYEELAKIFPRKTKNICLNFLFDFAKDRYNLRKWDDYLTTKPSYPGCILLQNLLKFDPKITISVIKRRTFVLYCHKSSFKSFYKCINRSKQF
ncbi:hypothetical protein MHBO_001948 [Bonamia ostreae]|uniref:Uncharacterized protein n=1 Tax=Bonamia ostreae TaxID=126728 RepID=A0ABV2ALI4_9EUKA